MFTKLYYHYTDLVYKYNSKCRDLFKKGLSHPCFHGDVINKAKKLKSDTSNFGKYLKNLIRKDCDLATI